MEIVVFLILVAVSVWFGARLGKAAMQGAAWPAYAFLLLGGLNIYLALADIGSTAVNWIGATLGIALFLFYRIAAQQAKERDGESTGVGG
jgi:CBS domain containing-hemolysin-like protein